MTLKVKRLIKDPFVMIIAVVVFVPAMLFAFGIISQGRPLPMVNGASSEQSSDNHSAPSAEPTKQQPITDAESPEPVESAPKDNAENAPDIRRASAEPVCDQAKKQAAEDKRKAQINKENLFNTKQKNRLRLSSFVSSRYWEEEIARHQSVLVEINATYMAALAAANC